MQFVLLKGDLILKGQSNEKVCEIITLNKGSPTVFKILKLPI
jgi:hypothetical protein